MSPTQHPPHWPDFVSWICIRCLEKVTPEKSPKWWFFMVRDTHVTRYICWVMPKNTVTVGLWRFSTKVLLSEMLSSWWFKVTFLGWLSEPFQRLSDLQLGDEKVTLNHLVDGYFHTVKQIKGMVWFPAVSTCFDQPHREELLNTIGLLESMAEQRFFWGGIFKWMRWRESSSCSYKWLTALNQPFTKVGAHPLSRGG